MKVFISLSLALLWIIFNSLQIFSQFPEKPNVILIITDDQGYGDLHINGNPHIKTPVIDKLAEESIRFNNFYVSPVCAPTRSSLMTGRYSLKTGIRDTYNGGAIMATTEITIAEMLKEAGYKTGIFGKWHLGDNYPSRPNDQGFDESVIHLSGGMGQVGDFTTWFRRDSSYFNPVLWHNGRQEAYRGYCSDIFTDQAINFISQNKEGPFFCYLSFNAPHTPLQVPDDYYKMYEDIEPASGFSDDIPFPEMNEKDCEDARKVYAMVTNIDDNLSRLFKLLEDLDLSENTMIIFMTDNGPQQRRYIAGLRGRKGSVYRGGIKVPFYVKYPPLGFDKDIDINAAHIDVLPTIAQICQVELPRRKTIDGRSLLPAIMEENPDRTKDRSLFFYWSRRYPELYNNISLQKGPYKLVGNTDFDAEITDFELFNIEDDPYEQNNIIDSEIEIARNLRAELDNRYNELISSENIQNPPVIEIGTVYENPVFLNRNDADGQRGIWAQEEIFGKWNLKINQGRYNIRFKFVKPLKAGGELLLETNGVIRSQKLEESSDIIEMKGLYFDGMSCEFIPIYKINGKSIFPFWVEIERTGDQF